APVVVKIEPHDLQQRRVAAPLIRPRFARRYRVAPPEQRIERAPLIFEAHVRVPRPGLRQRDHGIRVGLAHGARHPDHHPPDHRIELPPRMRGLALHRRPPPPPIGHHRRPVAALDDRNVTGEAPAIARGDPARELGHQVNDAAVVNIFLFNPRRPLVMTEREVNLSVTDRGQPIKVAPVKFTRLRIRAREPRPVAVERQAELFAEQPVVGFQLLGVPGQLQLMKVQLLLPAGSPATDMAGIECACQLPRSHQTLLRSCGACLPISSLRISTRLPPPRAYSRTSSSSTRPQRWPNPSGSTLSGWSSSFCQQRSSLIYESQGMRSHVSRSSM